MKKLVRKTIKVKNTLDTRQVAYLVQCAGQFKSDVRIEEDEKTLMRRALWGRFRWLSRKAIQFR